MESMPIDVGGACRLLTVLVLGGAGVAKLADRNARTTAADAALMAAIHDASWRIAVWRTVASVELLVAGSILIVPGVLPSMAAAAWFGGAAAFSVWAAQSRPTSSCGCFGSASRTGFGGRTVLRALLLLGVAAAGAFLPGRTDAAVASRAGWFGLLFIGAVLVLISPERRVLFATVAGEFRYIRCLRPASFGRIRSNLLRTAAWRDLEPLLLEPQPRRHWTEGGWQFLIFGVRDETEHATAMVAVPRCGALDGWHAAILDGNGRMIRAIGSQPS